MDDQEDKYTELKRTRREEKLGEIAQMFFLHIDRSQIKKSAFPKHGVNNKVLDNHLINITGKFEPSRNSTIR